MTRKIKFFFLHLSPLFSFWNEQGMVTASRAYTQIGLNTTNVPASTLTTNRKWEHDDDVYECRQCKKKFNFWIRKHHCR